MKQIIIFLLVVIALLIGYGKYKQYKRFTPPEYEYKTNEAIDLDYHDREFLKAYYNAVESLNGYVITQWSANEIDVRNPENDDDETLAATAEYEKRLGEVRYYEDQLLKSANLKKEGRSNKDIEMMETKGMTLESYQANLKKEKSKKMLWGMFKQELSSNNLQLGSRSAFIHEIQKILVAKGYDIRVDGVYKNATADAVRQYETSNGLFADGYLDALTLEHLLR